MWRYAMRSRASAQMVFRRWRCKRQCWSRVLHTLLGLLPTADVNSCLHITDRLGFPLGASLPFHYIQHIYNKSIKILANTNDTHIEYCNHLSQCWLCSALPPDTYVPNNRPRSSGRLLTHYYHLSLIHDIITTTQPTVIPMP